MKPYLFGQSIFQFVDDSLLCSSSHLATTNDYSLQVTPSFLHWKQQDQLILSALISFISMDVLHFIVNC